MDLNSADERLRIIRRQDAIDLMQRKTYAGKISKAVEKFADPFEREVARVLTAPRTVGVLKNLKQSVGEISAEFTTAEERYIALRLLRDGLTELAAVVTVVRGTLQEAARNGG